MQIIYKKIDEVIPYEKNPRKNDEAVNYVTNSIKEFGFKNPIILDKNNVIIAGHTRLLGAKKLGMQEVPCIYADDLTDEQVKAFRLADNKVAEIAEWNLDLLDEELNDILDIDMSDFGFDASVFDSDEFGTDFELPSGDKGNIEQITFTLANEQATLIREALEMAKDDITETFGNENKNGNAIYEVVKQWVELKK